MNTTYEGYCLCITKKIGYLSFLVNIENSGDQLDIKQPEARLSKTSLLWKDQKSSP